MKKSTVIRIVCMVFAAALFCFSAYKIISIVAENKQGESHYADLADTVVQTAPEPTEGQPEQVKEQAPITVDFSELLRENEDVIGWIYCENTPINYPVLQSDDNDYYLRRLMNGKRNTAGSIFADYRSSADLSDRNTIIYGHNMRNNTMFGTLKGYHEQDYYEQHPVIWFLTPNGNYKIELISAYITPADATSVTYQDFDTDEDLQAYIAEILGKSTFQTNAGTEGIDRIVTLSTCVRGMDTKRYVLIGAVIPV